MSEEDLENGIREYAERLKRRPLTEGMTTTPVGPHPIDCDSPPVIYKESTVERQEPINLPPPLIRSGEFTFPGRDVSVELDKLAEQRDKYLRFQTPHLMMNGLSSVPLEPEADEPTIREGSS